MNINFDPQTQNAVNAAIADGKFSSQEEMIKTVMADYLEIERQKQWLHDEIEASIAEDNEPGITFEELKARLAERRL